MGKGNRNKLDRAQAKIDSPEEYLARRRQLNKQNKSKAGLGTTITCIVLVVAILLTIVIGALDSTGVFARLTNTLQTENFVVTEAMMQYFYNEYVLNWLNSSNGQMYVMYGLIDFTTDLRTQQCTVAESGTWYDYFVEGAVENVTMYLTYAEGAIAAGITLTKEDKQDIDESIKLVKKTLKDAGETIGDRYGDKVSATDIRKCFEIIELASKFNEAKTQQLEEAVRNDAQKIMDYPLSHKAEFYTATYISYTITVKDEMLTFKDDDTKLEAAKAEAKANAEIIAAAKDSTEFFDLVKVYVASEEAKSEEATTKELKYEDHTKEVSYAESSDLDKWLFVEGADVNASKVIEEASTEKSTDSSGATVNTNVYKYTAYMVVKKSSLNTDLTMNLGYIITTDKAVAENIRNSFIAGEKTAANLAKLGQEKYNELAAEGSSIQVGSGSSKNAQTDAFKGTYDEFDAWLNGDRKPGELSEIITITPKSDGASTYYIVGYVEDWSDTVWMAQAISSMVNEQMEEWYQGADGNGGQLALTPVEKKEKSLKGMDLSQYFINLSYSLMSSMSSGT